MSQNQINEIHFTREIFYKIMVLCIVPFCNEEAYRVIMLYYFPRFSKKSICKTVFRMCDIHARKISGKDTIVKIQILN